jgi:predicted dehydrogenase
VLTDKGPHGLDLLMALFGPPHVTRCEDDALRDGVEANSRVGLEFARATGFMQVSWDQPLVEGVHVTGSRGELKLDLEHPDRLMWRRSDGLWQPLVGSRDWPTDLESPAKRRAFPRAYSDCIHYQLVQVLRSIVHLEPLPVTGDDGLRVVRAIERCYELARPLALPWLSADEQERSSALHWSHPR